MYAHDHLTRIMINAGIYLGLDLDDREARALHEALEPWVAWMRRPDFPHPDAGLPVDPEIHDGWAVDANGDLIPPGGFREQFPEWAYALTLKRGIYIRRDGRRYWRMADGIVGSRAE